jgi:hypothetical protein
MAEYFAKVRDVDYFDEIRMTDPQCAAIVVYRQDRRAKTWSIERAF